MYDFSFSNYLDAGTPQGYSRKLKETARKGLIHPVTPKLARKKMFPALPFLWSQSQDVSKKSPDV